MTPTLELNKPSQLLSLTSKTVISKRNLFDLIQFSKQNQTEYYEGDEWKINNTPQQGINWIGNNFDLKAVIIKTRKGSYADDGWRDNEKTVFSYSFKAQQGVINYNDNANKSLINQPIGGYPILLFSEKSSNWIFEGLFTIIKMDKTSVVLKKIHNLLELNKNQDIIPTPPTQKDVKYIEGERKFVTHLLAERNAQVIKDLKNKMPWICDICNLEFIKLYSKNYIEAHHKRPLHTYQNSHTVSIEDFVMLCSNCHKAVHILLREDNLEYDCAKDKILSLLNNEQVII
ncbi:HNH endonuclease [Enterobacter cancerogenus]|jgi:putative restriction endonuclease|uniref:HNH endonuclease n=1 Tax=Enterobacter cancerogenus TaxID=69218 RepID=A0ABX8KQP4_9ENTR|nr:HNH endonuclease [Enterobacter cancerogenus]QXA51072.1 HNH endonuclease [Enterobacter cancerogenus]